MNDYFELTGERKENPVSGPLYRVRCTKDIPLTNVQKGDLGGWVSSINNLRDYGWVYDEAEVCGNAIVSGAGSSAAGNAVVKGNAKILCGAIIEGDAIVSGNAIVDQYACVFSGACVSGKTRITEGALVGGAVYIYGESHIGGEVRMLGRGDYYGAKINNVDDFIETQGAIGRTTFSIYRVDDFTKPCVCTRYQSMTFSDIQECVRNAMRHAESLEPKHLKEFHFFKMIEAQIMQWKQEGEKQANG